MKYQKGSKLYFSIGEVATKLGVNVSAIKHWEREFPHLRPRTTAGGTRQYTSKDIDAIQVVYHLIRERKITTEGARAELKVRQSDLELRENTIARLERILLDLKDIQSRLPDPSQ